jgi:surfeit locus 1 family protein
MTSPALATVSPPGDDASAARRPRSAAALTAIGLAALVFFGGFLALGVWQLERRAWKLDLIERVDARIHAAPTAAPGPADWPELSAATDEYRRVIAAGTFVPEKTTLTQAVTEQGAGFWVLAPLKTTQGFTVLVNRGFVPAEKRGEAQALTPSGPAAVTGLLRITEPGGGFLRANDPAADRWTSRDVGAIASARGLDDAAPYFIDADATPNPGGLPVGGLTVVAFRNSHLVYALTWFALAAMVAGGAWILFAHERALRRR